MDTKYNCKSAKSRNAKSRNAGKAGNGFKTAFLCFEGFFFGNKYGI